MKLKQQLFALTLCFATSSAHANIEVLTGVLKPGEKLRIEGVQLGQGQRFTVTFDRSLPIYFDGVGTSNYYTYGLHGQLETRDTHPVYDSGLLTTNIFTRQIDANVTRGWSYERPGSRFVSILLRWGYTDLYNQDAASVSYTARIARYAAVPEPSTWAFMVLAFAVAGSAVRRAKLSVAKELALKA